MSSSATSSNDSRSDIEQPDAKILRRVGPIFEYGSMKTRRRKVRQENSARTTISSVIVIMK